MKWKAILSILVVALLFSVSVPYIIHLGPQSSDHRIAHVNIIRTASFYAVEVRHFTSTRSLSGNMTNIENQHDAFKLWRNDGNAIVLNARDCFGNPPGGIIVSQFSNSTIPESNWSRVELVNATLCIDRDYHWLNETEANLSAIEQYPLLNRTKDPDFNSTCTSSMSGPVTSMETLQNFIVRFLANGVLGYTEYYDCMFIEVQYRYLR